MNEANPMRRSDILSRKVGDEWMIYDSNNESVHVLNSTAEFVLRLCDGVHSVSEMEKQLQQAFNVSEEAALDQDLGAILDTFAELGIIGA